MAWGHAGDRSLAYISLAWQEKVPCAFHQRDEIEVVLGVRITANGIGEGRKIRDGELVP